MSKKTLAIIAATTVSLIYGVTFTVAKDVMPEFILPYGFILMRVGGAVFLFWLIWGLLMLKKPSDFQKIDSFDFIRIIAAAFFGVALNMLTFFKGLSYTSPISAAVIMVTTPIIVLLLSAIMVKEKINLRMAFGVILGLLGTIFLILYGKSMGNTSNAVLGNFLVFVNAVSYGFYLIVVKKLMLKYNVFTFVKWIYLFGFLMVLPFGFSEFQRVVWVGIPHTAMLKIGFVIIFSTFFTYLLNLLSMKELKPTTISVFIYLQPLFASLFAIGLGKDEMNWVKFCSSILIFTGVYLVTIKK